jgi:hypothetical protein
MSVDLAISDALHRRLPRFEAARFAAFQLAAVDVAKARAQGEFVFLSPINGRKYFALVRGEYTLYYSLDPLLPPQQQAQSLVFEEFLAGDEAELIMDLFAGWPEQPDNGGP